MKTRYKIEYTKKGISYLGPETLEWHHKNYLKTGPGKPYSELHSAMRNYGIDWFKVTGEVVERRGGNQYVRTEEYRKRISEIQKVVRASMNCVYNPPKSKDWPHSKTWRVLDRNGMHYITNLKKWCKQNGHNYDVVKFRYYRKSFPYRDIELIDQNC